MKSAVVLFALVAIAAAAPQPKKIFHENFEDFISVITQEVSDELAAISEKYEEFEEYRSTVDFLTTTNFKQLVTEMESLPEFRAVQDYLESHNVDIGYFIDYINYVFDVDKKRARSARQTISGTDFNSWVMDSIAVLPQEKLAALYDEKIAEDADFKAAIEGVQSEEFEALLDALWENEVFDAEMKTLADNGIDVTLLIVEVFAIFGQVPNRD